MNFLKKICFFLFCLLSFNAFAYSILTTKVDTMSDKIKLSTYPDYFPFGYVLSDSSDNYFPKSVFLDAVYKINPEKKQTFKIVYYSEPSTAVLEMREGKLQVFMGAFYATATFNDLDFIYPAVLNDPIHLMMLPHKISQVHQVGDLKKLKGAYVSTERFSDYMLQTFRKLNLTPIENLDQAYEKLLVGEIDFILGSYYFHYAKMLERGLKGFVSFSSKPLWNMPMFFALSKRIDDRKTLHEYFRRLALSETFKKNLLEGIKDLIKEKEEQSVGIVPPMYVRQTESKELTPAEERERQGE